MEALCAEPVKTPPGASSTLPGPTFFSLLARRGLHVTGIFRHVS